MKESTTEGNGGGQKGSSAPVYVRLQQRAEAESRPARAHPKLHKFRFASMGFLLFVVVSCCSLFLVRFVEGDVHFRLHNVELRGGKYVTAEQVSELFYPDHDRSIYLVPLEQRRHEIEQIPWVRSATVMLVLPDRISVAVEERQPVAFLWSHRGIVLIDSEGVILDTPPNSSWVFPVLRGVSERELVDKRKTRLEPYLKLRAELRGNKDEFPPEISEVDLSDPTDLSLVVTDSAGAVKLHMGDEKFSDRYSTYRSHIAEWRQQFNEIQSIDLRYQDQAVIQSGLPTTVTLGGKPGSSPAAAAPKLPTPQATTLTPPRNAL
jgi:cell division protein FtsQ